MLRNVIDIPLFDELLSKISLPNGEFVSIVFKITKYIVVIVYYNKVSVFVFCIRILQLWLKNFLSSHFGKGICTKLGKGSPQILLKIDLWLSTAFFWQRLYFGMAVAELLLMKPSEAQASHSAQKNISELVYHHKVFPLD